MQCNLTVAGALHAEAHHELDGFVHHDAHHPFALPDDDDNEADDAFVFGSGDRSRAASPTHLHDVELALDGGFMLTIAEVDEAHPRGAVWGWPPLADRRKEKPLEHR